MVLIRFLKWDDVWGDMSPYWVSGAKPQQPNILLDIMGAYVSSS